MSQLLCQGQRGRALKSACIRLCCRMPDQTPLCQTNEETKLSIKYTERERERLRDADARTRTGPSLRRAEGALTKELGPGPGAVAGLSGGSPPSRAAQPSSSHSAWPARSSSRCRRRPRPLRRPPKGSPNCVGSPRPAAVRSSPARSPWAQRLKSLGGGPWPKLPNCPKLQTSQRPRGVEAALGPALGFEGRLKLARPHCELGRKA